MAMAKKTSVEISADIVDDAIRMRRELHQIPELRFEERLTASLIRKELGRMGISFIENIPGVPTATVAHIGDTARPCVALRADIDALPIKEETGAGYASRHPGCMHACGHDGHTACMLGAAAVLKQMESQLPVCIKLIFQPAEESGGGAEKLVEAGILDGRVGPKVQRIFGVHGRPELAVGLVTTKPGALMAATATFRAEFHGRGSHGAQPNLGRDPIVAAADGIIALQQIVSREIDPIDSAVVTVGMVSGCTATNVIPEMALIEGTARTLSPEMGRYVHEAVERRLRGVAGACDVKLELAWLEGYPAVINDPLMVDFVRDVARAALGEGAFVPAAAATMGGEDFAYYLQKVPGCFAFVGTGLPGAPHGGAGLHHPRYDYNDEAIAPVIRLLVALALNCRDL